MSLQPAQRRSDGWSIMESAAADHILVALIFLDFHVFCFLLGLHVSISWCQVPWPQRGVRGQLAHLRSLDSSDGQAGQ